MFTSCSLFFLSFSLLSVHSSYLYVFLSLFYPLLIHPSFLHVCNCYNVCSLYLLNVGNLNNWIHHPLITIMSNGIMVTFTFGYLPNFTMTMFEMFDSLRHYKISIVTSLENHTFYACPNEPFFLLSHRPSRPKAEKYFVYRFRKQHLTMEGGFLRGHRPILPSRQMALLWVLETAFSVKKDGSYLSVSR